MWDGVREGWGLGWGGVGAHAFIHTGHCYSRKQHGDADNGTVGLSDSLLLLCGFVHSERSAECLLFYKAVGVNVEIEATCCMKQLRHYACCRPATLRGKRVKLLMETWLWSLKAHLVHVVWTFTFFFLKSADGLELLFLISPFYKK